MARPRAAWSCRPKRRGPTGGCSDGTSPGGMASAISCGGRDGPNRGLEKCSHSLQARAVRVCEYQVLIQGHEARAAACASQARRMREHDKTRQSRTREAPCTTLQPKGGMPRLSLAISKGELRVSRVSQCMLHVHAHIPSQGRQRASGGGHEV